VSRALTVSVEFVDAATGRTFARSDVPAEQLPETFEVDTTLTLEGESWSVVGAEPPTAAEVRASGRLVLTLSRVTFVSPHEILYSLPTLCDRLPTVDPAADHVDRLRMHEDDWRQVELISAGLVDVVTAELAAVRRVFSEQTVTGPGGGIIGFRGIHVRAAPATPLIPPLSLASLRQALPAQHTYAGIGFLDAPGVMVDSFAFKHGSIDVYGLATDDAVTVLGLRPTGRPSGAVDTLAAGIAGVMRAGTLVVVDWCRCAVVDPDSVGAYLQAMA
jgi:hypothetical protein